MTKAHQRKCYFNLAIWQFGIGNVRTSKRSFPCCLVFSIPTVSLCNTVCLLTYFDVSMFWQVRWETWPVHTPVASCSVEQCYSPPAFSWPLFISCDVDDNLSPFNNDSHVSILSLLTTVTQRRHDNIDTDADTTDDDVTTNRSHRQLIVEWTTLQVCV